MISALKWFLCSVVTINMKGMEKRMEIFLDPWDDGFQAGLHNNFPFSKGSDSPGKKVVFLCSKAISHLVLFSADATETNIHKQ